MKTNSQKASLVDGFEAMGTVFFWIYHAPGITIHQPEPIHRSGQVPAILWHCVPLLNGWLWSPGDKMSQTMCKQNQAGTLWLCQNSYGKSPFLMGKSTINGHFQ